MPFWNQMMKHVTQMCINLSDENIWRIYHLWINKNNLLFLIGWIIWKFEPAIDITVYIENISSRFSWTDRFIISRKSWRDVFPIWHVDFWLMHNYYNRTRLQLHEMYLIANNNIEIYISLKTVSYSVFLCYAISRNSGYSHVINC